MRQVVIQVRGPVHVRVVFVGTDVINQQFSQLGTPEQIVYKPELMRGHGNVATEILENVYKLVREFLDSPGFELARRLDVRFIQ